MHVCIKYCTYRKSLKSGKPEMMCIEREETDDRVVK